jgi:hypothetical protein
MCPFSISKLLQIRYGMRAKLRRAGEGDREKYGCGERKRESVFLFLIISIKSPAKAVVGRDEEEEEDEDEDDEEEPPATRPLAYPPRAALTASAANSSGRSGETTIVRSARRSTTGRR